MSNYFMPASFGMVLVSALLVTACSEADEPRETRPSTLTEDRAPTLELYDPDNNYEEFTAKDGSGPAGYSGTVGLYSASELEAMQPAVGSPPASKQVRSSVFYRNCSAARAAGAAPVRRGNPGYASHLDRDNDGIGCEWH